MKFLLHSGQVSDKTTSSLFTATLLLALFSPFRAAAFAPAQGDFAKADPAHIRVLSYNTERKFIKKPATDAVFQRIITAAHPDIIAFQEIDDTTSNTSAGIATLVKRRLESYFPGETWSVHMGTSDGFIQNALATRHGLSMKITDTMPGSDVRGITAGLVDLPDGTHGSTDFYVMAVHLKSFDTQSDHMRRQRYADAIVNWMRDARTTDCLVCPGGDRIDLPPGTPILAVGDMNLGYLEGGDYAPYHPTRTLRTGDIYDEATYGADAPPDWDGTESEDAAPYDHNTGDAHTHPSTTTNPTSRLDRFIYTDSAIHPANRFILNTLTMTPGAIAAAGLLAGDTVQNTNGASDHLPVVVDFALGPNPAQPGRLVINEFNYDNPGADTRSFVELKNVGGREVNLQAPVDYHVLTSTNNLPTSPPAVKNQNLAIDLQGIVPPGGVFVVYHSTGESVDVASSITAALPVLQRQDRAATGGAFTLYNGPDAALALVSVEPWTTAGGSNTTTFTLVEAYLYEDTSPGADNYFRTDSGNALTISLRAAQSSGYELLSNTQSYSRNVGNSAYNTFEQWSIPDTMTPGLENASPLNTPPTLVAAAGVTVGRGETVVITSAELETTDAEQGPAALIYTVSVFPAHGTLMRNATPLAPGGPATFTQADVNGGLVRYAHGGVGADPDEFTFTVSDGKGGLIGPAIFPIAVTAPTGVSDWWLVH